MDCDVHLVGHGIEPATDVNQTLPSVSSMKEVNNLETLLVDSCILLQQGAKHASHAENLLDISTGCHAASVSGRCVLTVFANVTDAPAISAIFVLCSIMERLWREHFVLGAIDSLFIKLLCLSHLCLKCSVFA
ncbi:uncharacterized protein LOC112570108 [Pomacea canaliculata]|uniref:uncharacterized protein LOC112570108 n=1 Tax=Pomacea canaliculata TaxID=400727 RepID=UPI000D73C47C|nr:uncharacterized protein LOC112570108 [Pomacea canaliculata]